MKGIFFTVLALLGHYLAYAQAYHDTLTYSSSRKLTWDVFQAATDGHDLEAKGELPAVVALHAIPKIKPVHKVEVATDLLMGFRQVHLLTGVGNFWVSAVVYKDRCWVDPKHTTEEVLAHAQVHFEIAELFARQLETDINAKKINASHRTKIDRFFSEYHSQMKQVQQLFDQETEGGENLEKQKEWERKIRLKLTSIVREGTK